MIYAAGKYTIEYEDLEDPLLFPIKLLPYADDEKLGLPWVGCNEGNYGMVNILCGVVMRKWEANRDGYGSSKIEKSPSESHIST